MGDREQLLILRGLISELPEAEQAQVKDCQAKIREVLAAYPSVGLMALAAVGLEEAVK